ncbi:MAG: RusA family crossover junction endodeoxyribonuclease [Chloroflexi bacterium CFX6]|nr:RusA family crossover junction endodeoxyribonuclease [Chloroflexi bacterium CFX6]
MRNAITFVIPGEIVPYTRIGRERWTDRARRYLASRDAVRSIAAAAVGAQIDDEARSGRWYAGVTFYRFKRRGDVDNLLKAVLDALQGVVWHDDAQVDAIDARRMRCRRGEDRAVVAVAEIGR